MYVCFHIESTAETNVKIDASCDKSCLDSSSSHHITLIILVVIHVRGEAFGPIFDADSEFVIRIFPSFLVRFLIVIWVFWFLKKLNFLIYALKVQDQIKLNVIFVK